ncbi:hypothetical protein GJAV_G00087180 [Gymnothorax javanicus]|nr:hypothetical protein GJAV_G00087180 [Gymnothorax javanicus]
MGTQPPSSLNEIFEDKVRKQGLKIATDPTHVLNTEYELMPLGKRHRNRKEYGCANVTEKSTSDWTTDCLWIGRRCKLRR